jgi:hypothetical protein
LRPATYVTADSYKPDKEGILAFNGGEVVKLRGSNKVGLSVAMRYRIRQVDEAGRGPWKVSTVGYMYDLVLDGKKLYEYHWHPISASHEVRPHLHCSAVGKGHIPTGRINDRGRAEPRCRARGEAQQHDALERPRPTQPREVRARRYVGRRSVLAFKLTQYPSVLYSQRFHLRERRARRLGSIIAARTKAR